MLLPCFATFYLRFVSPTLVLSRTGLQDLPCPQEEAFDPAGWTTDPPGFHMIPIPFADDIRAAPIDEGHQGEFLDLGT